MEKITFQDWLRTKKNIFNAWELRQDNEPCLYFSRSNISHGWLLNIKGKIFKDVPWYNHGDKSFLLFSYRDKEKAIQLTNDYLLKTRNKAYMFIPTPFGRTELIPDYIINNFKREYKQFLKQKKDEAKKQLGV